MTRSSHQANTLIVAATCAVAVGAYVAYSMHQQESSGEKERDDDTVCSDMTAKNTTKVLSHHSVPKTPPSLPRTTLVPAKKMYSIDQLWNSPGKVEKNDSTGMFLGAKKGNSTERMPPSPIFSRSGDDVSDDDLSLDGALPPFNISSESSFSGDLSKSVAASYKGPGLRWFLVLVLVAAGACCVCSMGAATTATPSSLPMIITAWTSATGETTPQGNKHRSLVTRGVTDVAAFHPLGVLSLLHGSMDGDDSSVVGNKQKGDNDSWQRSLNGCYGPFFGF